MMKYFQMNNSPSESLFLQLIVNGYMITHTANLLSFRRNLNEAIKNKGVIIYQITFNNFLR